MQYSARMFSTPEDTEHLVRVVSALFAPPAGLWHVGDVWWGLYQNTVFRPQEHIRLWWDADGRPLGFVWFYPPDEFSWQLLPGTPDRKLLEDEMFEWAEQHARDVARHEGLPNPTVTSSALDVDPDGSGCLLRRGFRRAERRFIHLYRDLAAAPLPADADAGVVVRPIAGPHEYEARVNLHRDVWQPSKVTIEAYERLQTAAGYEADLDLVAVTPEGTLASYCICWLDRITRVGLFEPVGTRYSCRRKGYGRAVMLEGLRRLRDRGMARARVLSAADNEAAIALYRSAGFQAHAGEYLYVKEL
ncbi:MAG TPA: GNAT family N-acetyltransferase [Chloroflexota bacterium]|nr:GNAT family N-acetyltransferase [Chloroflexota bacterium]